MSFFPCNFFLKIGNPFENVWVYSFTPSHTFESMKCDSRASLSAHIFTSPCLGLEPKSRVATREE
jgi:hypothetical protein